MRLTVTDFSKGIWLVAGKETAVKGFMRRAKGMHALRTLSLRSRAGSFTMFALSNVVSLFPYSNSEMLCGTSDGKLYHRNTLITTGYSGDILRYVLMPPQSGIADQIFITDRQGVTGGPLLKIDPATWTKTSWGIAAPAGGATANDNGAGAMAAGTYQYHIVFLNHITGSRSNPTSIPATVTIAVNHQVALTVIPVSSDTQVTRREIYRTSAGGARFFRIATINDNTTTTFNDNIPDTSASISSFELQFDNAPPNQFSFAWRHGQQMWWCGDGTGRAYYSPPGRPESMRGFIDVSGSSDSVRGGISWNAANWVFTQKSLYRIEGDSEPFIAIPIEGVPGTQYEDSIASTPYGIAYVAADGPRLFDGVRSTLIGMEQLGPIFRGESIENINPFVSSIQGFYARDEYWLFNDATQALAISLRDQTWRQPGIIASAFGYEKVFGTVLAAFGGNVYDFESIAAFNTADGSGAAIPFEWEVGGSLTDLAHQGMIQRVFIDYESITGATSATVTVQLILDSTVYTIGTITGFQNRTLIEFPVGKVGRVFSVRLSGSTLARIEIFGVGIDVKLEGSQDEVGIG